MKNTLLILVAVHFLVLPMSQARLQGTNTSGGGGNSVVIQMRQILGAGLNSLSNQGVILVKGRRVALDELGRKLIEAEIETTTRDLYLDNGKKVSAINYPHQKKIILNEKEWNSSSPDSRMTLAFHELWGLTFADESDKNYDYSLEMTRLVRSSSLDGIRDLHSGQIRGEYIARALVRRESSDFNKNLSLTLQIAVDFAGSDIIIWQKDFKAADFPFKENTNIHDLRFSDLEVFSFIASTDGAIPKKCEVALYDFSSEKNNIVLSCKTFLEGF